MSEDHPVADTPSLQAAHPDRPHEFRTVCRLCGENGYLHIALITDLEVVKVEARAALAQPPAPPKEAT